MIAIRRIVVASAVAPLTLTLPGFIGAASMWAHFSSTAEPGGVLHTNNAVAVAALSVLPVYVGLACGYIMVAMLLRFFGYLTRRSLCIGGIAVSLALGLLLSCDWSETCETIETLQAFGIQSLIATCLLTGMSVVWWRMAAGTWASGASEVHHNAEA